jgi:hypothetical protein
VTVDEETNAWQSSFNGTKTSFKQLKGSSRGLETIKAPIFT